MRHKIEIFSAGCKICLDTIAMVKKLAGSEYDLVVHDMHEEETVSDTALYNIRSIPAVVIDGKLADCCSGRGTEEDVLREALR